MTYVRLIQRAVFIRINATGCWEERFFPHGTLLTARELSYPGGAAYGLHVSEQEDWTCSWLAAGFIERVSPLELLAQEAP